MKAASITGRAGVPPLPPHSMGGERAAAHAAAPDYFERADEHAIRRKHVTEIRNMIQLRTLAETVHCWRKSGVGHRKVLITRAVGNFSTDLLNHTLGLLDWSVDWERQIAHKMIALGADPKLLKSSKLDKLLADLNLRKPDDRQRAIVLIRAGANPTMRLTSVGSCALHFAAAYADLELMKTCIKSRAHVDLDVRNDQHMTPLMLASKHTYSMIAKLLIDAGADLNAMTPLGQSCLDEASDEMKWFLKEAWAAYLAQDRDRTYPQWVEANLNPEMSGIPLALTPLPLLENLKARVLVSCDPVLTASVGKIVDHVENEDGPDKFQAVPADPVARKQFYADFRNVFEHVVAALNDPDVTADQKQTAFACLAQGAAFCATRQFQEAQVALEILNSSSTVRPQTSADQFASVLFEGRMDIVRSFMDSLLTDGAGQPHIRNFVLGAIGREVAVAHAGTSYDDPYSIKETPQNKAVLLTRFCAQYTPRKMVRTIQNAIAQKRIGVGQIYELLVQYAPPFSHQVRLSELSLKNELAELASDEQSELNTLCLAKEKWDEPFWLAMTHEDDTFKPCAIPYLLMVMGFVKPRPIGDGAKMPPPVVQLAALRQRMVLQRKIRELGKQTVPLIAASLQQDIAQLRPWSSIPSCDQTYDAL